jgi:hypothetical protein
MTRLCRDCHVHAAVADGNRCADCLNALLRRTRPAAIREPAWRTWTREHQNAKAIA